MADTLNCLECKMESRCSHKREDCKYPEGRKYGVTDKQKPSYAALEAENARLRAALEEIEPLIAEFLAITTTNKTHGGYNEAWAKIREAAAIARKALEAK